MNLLSTSASAFVALALMAAPATAATFIEPWTVAPNGAISVTIGDNGLDVAGGSVDPINGNSTHAYNAVTRLFTDTFDFFLPRGLVGASVITIGFAANSTLTFSNISLNGVNGGVFAGGSAATVGAQPILLGGPQHLIVTGTGGPDAAWGGAATFAPFAPVPEPTSWALMIGGFTALGVALRRHRRSPLYQLS